MSLKSDEQLAAIFEDLTGRLRAGTKVTLQQATVEFPDYADDIRELWTTLLLTEDLAQDLSEMDTILDEGPRPAGTPPKQVGDYELGKELGRGGMGVVFEARQISLNRRVAVKMILRGEFATEVELARFRAEAESAARLEHPNIVSVYEVGEHAGQPYFSMQHIPGTTLARRLAEGPLPARESAELLLPVCRAVAHAHKRGILHRDLKPSNILIDTTGRPLVTDFGLAKQLHRGDEADGAATVNGPVTRSGDLLGTPGYMAPEQAAGNRGTVTQTTDVYALGAMLYAMLTGRPPFQAASPVDTLMMVLEQDPPMPRLLNAAADVDLELIALKALQKPADLRYASADALADDLQAFLNQEPISARSSHFSQILSRAFRPTHHVAVLEHWGVLWMWHSAVILVLCLVTNAMQLGGVTARWPYAGLWTLGLGTWALIFWNLRRRGGPVTFVERQIAHVWAASMAASTMLFAVEGLLHLPVLTLSPVLALLAGGVFVVKAGILSGEFYFPAALLFAASIPMAIWPSAGLTIFGVVSWLTFFVPGWKFHRQKVRGMRRE
jgi:eukaryotic-like serine/threonine-protein kinase